MGSQGLSLVLSSYQAWRYHPEGGSLRALATNMRQRLASFKNSELATAIEAFSALGFHPGNDLVQVSRNSTLSVLHKQTPPCTRIAWHGQICLKSELLVLRDEAAKRWWATTVQGLLGTAHVMQGSVTIERIVRLSAST